MKPIAVYVVNTINFRFFANYALEVPKEEIFAWIMPPHKTPPTLSGLAQSINKDCCVTVDFYWTALSIELVFDISITILGYKIQFASFTLVLVKPLLGGCLHLAEAGPAICLNVDAKCYSSGRDGLENIGLD